MDVMGARRLYMEMEWNLCELSAMIADQGCDRDEKK